MAAKTPPLTYAALVATYPWLATYPEAKVQQWIDLAPVAVNSVYGRFKAENVSQARVLYVLHNVVSANAPFKLNKSRKEVTRQIPTHSAPNLTTTKARRKAYALAAWGTTSHGHMLASLAQF
jgi:hypothetical protein